MSEWAFSVVFCFVNKMCVSTCRLIWEKMKLKSSSQHSARLVGSDGRLQQPLCSDWETTISTMNLTLLLTHDDTAQRNNMGIQKCPWTSCFAKSPLVVAISSRTCASDPSTGWRKALIGLGLGIDFPFLFDLGTCCCGWTSLKPTQPIDCILPHWLLWRYVQSHTRDAVADALSSFKPTGQQWVLCTDCLFGEIVKHQRYSAVPCLGVTTVCQRTLTPVDILY